MKTGDEQTPPKLVYLRGRAPRAVARARKPARRPSIGPVDELASEAVWLGRSLFVVAGAIGVYCALILTGSIQGDGEESRHWLLSLLVGDVFVGLCSAAGGVLLMREVKRASLYVALAAGALIVVALQGLTHLVVSGELVELTLTARLEVLLRSATMALGVWAISFLIRAAKRPPQA